MLNFFFGFEGRVRRSNYFFGALVAGCLYSVLCVSTFAAMGVHVGERLHSVTWDFEPSAVGLAIACVLSLIALWAMLALTVKRWHDVGMTGWFALLTLPPFANGMVFLLLCLLPGTTGANRFGSDPRGRVVAHEATA